MLSDLLCCCGIDCVIDQYHGNDNILSWDQWVSKQIESCISEEGYILLECSQMMFNLLQSVSDNPRIEMAVGHIYCQTFKYYLHNKTKYFLPFCINGISSSVIPYILSERRTYNFPFRKLPQIFFSGSKDSSPSFSQEDAEQLLANDDFASLKNLVATLTKQEEICQPTISKTGKGFLSLHYNITIST